MFVNENQNVITCPGIILWDGVTNPGRDDKTGAIIHSLKIAIPESALEKTEIEQLAMTTLQNSEFKGQFPVGGEWPIRAIDVSKLGDSAPLMNGRVAINANTRNGVPPVYDANGQELSAMQFGQMLFPGAIVKLLVHCYSFNNKSKGLALGLDGVMIVDATQPKLDVGGGMSRSQVANAFGFGGGMPIVPPSGMPPSGMPTGGMPTGGMPTVPPSGMPPSGMPTGGSVQPHPGFVTGAGLPGAPPAAVPAPAAQKIMTPKAGNATYEQLIAQGWDDAQLIAQGYMQS